MEDVDVMKSLSVVGKTNKDGYAFVHNVIPYINYDISFDQDQLPLDYSFDQTTKKINALDKRGYIVDFNVAPTKKFIVRLKNINNQNFPLEQWLMSIMMKVILLIAMDCFISIYRKKQIIIFMC